MDSWNKARTDIGFLQFLALEAAQAFISGDNKLVLQSLTEMNESIRELLVYLETRLRAN